MRVRANGIALEYDEHGPRDGEPLLLVMGLGMQMIAWHDEFVALLAGRGFRVVRFDNRDIGLSQHFDAAGVPNLALDSLRHAFGLRIRSPYTLADMADDAAGLLEALGIARAHVCGASMGGMIAQHLALRHADRVCGLTLMMTTTGSRRLPVASLRVRAALMARPQAPGGPAQIVDHFVRLYRLIGSPAYPAPEAWLRERLAASIGRSYHPAGVARQMVAIAADGDRSAAVAAIRAPTHVIHGRADVLVPFANGADLAARIPGATFDAIDGMGHDLPRELWPRFAEGIESTVARSRAVAA